MISNIKNLFIWNFNAFKMEDLLFIAIIAGYLLLIWSEILDTLLLLNC